MASPLVPQRCRGEREGPLSTSSYQTELASLGGMAVSCPEDLSRKLGLLLRLQAEYKDAPIKARKVALDPCLPLPEFLFLTKQRHETIFLITSSHVYNIVLSAKSKFQQSFKWLWGERRPRDHSDLCYGSLRPTGQVHSNSHWPQVTCMTPPEHPWRLLWSCYQGLGALKRVTTRKDNIWP